MAVRILVELSGRGCCPLVEQKKGVARVSREHHVSGCNNSCSSLFFCRGTRQLCQHTARHRYVHLYRLVSPFFHQSINCYVILQRCVGFQLGERRTLLRNWHVTSTGSESTPKVYTHTVRLSDACKDQYEAQAILHFSKFFDPALIYCCFALYTCTRFRACAVFNLGEYRRIATATTNSFKSHHFFKQVREVNLI